MQKRNKTADIRTLCGRCRANYITAGFWLNRARGQNKEPCDICGRPGRNYIVSKLFEPPQL